MDTFARPLGPVSQFLKSSFQPVLIIADKRLTEHILTDKAWDRGDLLEGVFGGLAPRGMLALKTGQSSRSEHGTINAGTGREYVASGASIQSSAKPSPLLTEHFFFRMQTLR